MLKLDVLVIAAHPDDAELSCAGTICALVDQGKRVGVLDLTRGELGTRGDIHTRASESASASKILGIHYRGNVGLADGFFENNELSQKQLIPFVRELQPEIVLTNALSDRHPDHGKAAKFVVDTCFLSGLKKIHTEWEGKPQEEWRPKLIYHFIQDRLTVPDFVVDISTYWETKKKAILAYSTQFYNPSTEGPDTYISSPQYLQYIEARGVSFGHMIGVAYGEGFHSGRVLGVNNLFDLI
jgi:bacillithiol biosynthesis deacetylase BshB1